MKSLSITSVFFCYLLSTLNYLTSALRPFTGNITSLYLQSSTHVFNSSLTLSGRPAFLPHTIKVLDSEVTLNLGFGFIRNRLVPAQLDVLISVAQSYLSDEIRIHGADADFPVSGFGSQMFYKTLGDGVHIEVWNIDVQARFTWGILADVFDGLWLFLIERARYWQCWFEFSHYTGVTIGSGRVYAEAEDDRSAR